MRKLYVSLFLLITGLFFSLNLNAQVSLTATAGTTTGSFTTLKGAFDAINAGTHQGAIVININANTTETAPAVLNSTGAGSAVFTSVLIQPSADGLTITGVTTTGRGVIELNGADNVTINGDNPNTAGTNRNLTITSAASTSILYTSIIRLATNTNVTSSDNNAIRNCILTGTATGRNASANTSSSGVENTTFGIYAGGNGGTTATTAPTAVSSVTTVTAPSGTTINALVVDNNAINACARAIVFNGAVATNSTGVTVSNNLIGDQATALSGTPPYTTPATTVYTKGIYIAGTNAITITGNSIKNIISYVATPMAAIELNTAIGANGTTISSNTITGVVNNSTGAAFGINVSATTSNPTIASNTISNIHLVGAGTTNIAGIQVTHTGTAALIEKNRVSMVYNRSTGGYAAYGINVLSGNAQTVQNNFVWDINAYVANAGLSATYNIFGIRIATGTGHKIYHNSVYLSGAVLTGSTYASAAALLVVSTGSTGMDIRNNIFANTLTGMPTSSSTAAIMLPSGGTSAMNLTLNNNAYYQGSGTGAEIGQVGTTAVSGYTAAGFNPAATTGATNLRTYTSTLSAAGTNDNASVGSAVAPPFVSTSDLHLNTSAANINDVESKGANLSVANDIDGDARGATPDMGADEVTIVTGANDAGITGLTSTSFCPGVSNVSVVLKNIGTSALTSVTINWSVNGSPQTPYAWTGTLATGATANVVVGTYNFLGATNYSIIASTTLPNGTTDANPANDSYTSPSFQTSLTGTYTVGAAGNFVTLTAAVTAANTYGLCGPTTFSLIDASYAAETFPITINALTGASLTNTLTIKPATGISPTMTGSNANALIKLNGADYITIDGSNNGTTSRNFTLTNNGAGSVIWVGNATASDGANNNTAKNLVIVGAGLSTNFAGIMQSSGIAQGGVAEIANNANTYQNNDVSKVYYGIGVVGPATFDVGTVISNNLIGSTTVANKTGLYGLFISNQQNVTASGNTIYGLTTANSSTTTPNGGGIIITGTTSGGNVFNNVIRDIKSSVSYGVYGIVLNSSSTGIGMNIYNNMISDVAAAGYSSGAGINDNGYGIAVNTGAGYNIYYNTVSMNTDQTNSSAISAALWISSSITTAGALNIRDNIFSNTQSAAMVRYSVYSTAANTVFSAMDYNDYWCSGATTLAYRSGVVADLTALKTATGFGTANNVNSLNVLPVFTSATDLHLIPSSNLALNDFGTVIAGITTDIDGQTRPAAGSTNPDMGADEFSVPANDAGVTALVGSYCAGSQTVTVTLKNFGAATLTSATINWTVNGAAQTPFAWTGSIASGATANIAIGTFTFVGSTNYVIAATSSLPNGVADGNTANDTYTSPTFQTALSGTYTVGTAGNFTSITAAVAAANTYGLCGPTVFNLINTTYTETFPITLNVLAGSSATNTLTIKPNTTATISGSSTTGILVLNGTDYVTIDGSNAGGTDKSLTITNTATTASSSAILLSSLGSTAGATFDVIKNCNINTGSSAVITYGISIGTTAGTSGSDNDNATIQNNTFGTASTPIYAFGTSATAAGGLENLLITGNTITNSASVAAFGIRIGNAISGTISLNSIDVQTSGTTAAVGIALETGALNLLITRNTISRVAATSATATGARGITVGSGSATSGIVISNNMISGVLSSTNAASMGTASIGIALGIIGTSTTLTTTSGGISLYYNSVNMYGSYSSATANCINTGLFVGSGVSALDIRNNVLVNSITNAGAGTTPKSYTIYSNAAIGAFTTINFNDYYTSGAQGVLGYLTSDRTNIAGIQAGFGGNAASVNIDPLFTSNSNLHAQLTSTINGLATPLTSAANLIDIDADPRDATAPDMGADEFVGTAADVIPPSISYTALTNSCTPGVRTVTATISDASGVPTTGSGLPVAYFKINAGAYTAVQGTFVSGTTYTFNIGTGSINGDVVSYYVVAQDNAPTPNVAAFPSAGAAGFTANPPAASTPPTTPSTYTINNVLNGTYTVGTGQTYTTLGAAATAYNTLCIGGPVVFNVMTNTTETGAVTINANAAASAVNTLTIKAGAAGVVVSGSTTNGLITLNGAKYVTIDGSTSGGTDKNLTINNTSTTASSSAILLTSAGVGAGASNNTIKNTILTTGTASSITYGISVGTTAGIAGADNDNLTIQNNTITAAIGIYAIGTVTGVNDNLAINGNTINTPASNSVASSYGIEVGYATGAAIALNTITVNTTGAGQPVGISLEAGFVSSSVSRNNIQAVYTSATNGYGGRGITVATGTSSNVTISNNMISGVAGASNYTGFGNSSSMGIGIGMTGNSTTITTATSGINLYYNTINMSGNYPGYASGSTVTAALYVGSGASVLDIRNNIFVNTQANQNATYATGSKSYAIYSAAANTAFSNINYNDYSVGGTQGVLANIAGADATTLAALTTGFGGNANSKNIAPVFTSANDLHLVPASNITLDNLGTPISGITIDYDNDTRSSTTPDMGADEYSAPACTTAAGGTASAPVIAYCASGTPTITATGYSTGSGSTYQWESSTDNFSTAGVSIAGQTTPATLTLPGAVTATTYYRLKVTCATNTSTAYSNILTITINPAITASISPSSPAAVCAPATVTLTATTSAVTPTFQWYLNGTTPVGTNSNTYAAPVSGSYTVLVTDATTCSITSSAVTVTINPAPVAPVITPGTTQNICNGAIVTLSAASGGTGTILGENFNAIAVGAIPAGWSTSYTTATATYGAVTTANAGGTANEMRLNCINVNTTDNGTYALSLPTFSATGVTGLQANFRHMLDAWSATTYPYTVNFQTSPDGTTWTTRWSASTTGSTPIAATPISVDLSALNGQTTVYSRFALIGNIFGANYWYIDNAAISGTVANPITWSPTTGLYTDAGATTAYTGTATGTVYAKPSTNTTYTATATSANSCTATSTILINVSTLAIGQTHIDVLCFSGSTGTITASATGGTAPYQYSLNAGAYQVSPNFTGLAAGSYTLNVKDNNGTGCLVSTTVVVSQPASAVTVSTTSAVNPLCHNGTNGSFVAVGAGGTPGYTYSLDNITYQPSGSFTGLSGGTTYTVYVKDLNSCTSTTTITLTNPPLIIVSAGNNGPICQGATLNLTASGGTGYSWTGPNGFTSGAQNPSIASATPAATGIYTVTVTDANGCSNTATTTATVNATLPVSVTLVAQGGNNVCSGTLVTFEATATNGGSTPNYEFFVGVTSVQNGPSNTYTQTIAANESVYVIVTSNATCAGAPATSNTVNMVVTTTVTASVTLAASANPVCAGTSVTYTATGLGTGAAPTYNFFVNGSSVQNSPSDTYTFTPTNGNTIYVVMTSSSGCAIGNPATSGTITMTVNPIPAAPTVTPGGPTTFCTGGSVTLTSSQATGNTWSNGATTQTITVTTGGTYSVTYFNGNCTSPASTGVLVTVNPIPAAPTVTAGGPVTFCAGGSVTLTSSVATGNTWSNGETTQSIVVTVGGTYTVTQTVSGCPSAPSNSIVVTVTPLPVVTASASCPTVFTGGATLITASATGTGTLTYQWFSNVANSNTGGTTIGGAIASTYAPPTATTGTLYYYVEVTGTSCTSPSNAVSITVSNGPLNGTYTIGAAAGCTGFPTIASAVNYLNANGVAGPVIFNVQAGHTETSPAGGYVIGGTGSVILSGGVATTGTNTVTFNGNNAVVTAPAQASGVLADAIFKLVGADWITLSKFTMQENAANTTTAAATNNMTEFGVALLYASATDGAQNNTISENTITLNRTYSNTFGIYSNTRHTATAPTVVAEVTAASGSNSFNKVYKNSISNVNTGITFIGAGTTIAAIDNGNDIGGSSAATGNTITNWGGAVSATVYVSTVTSNYAIYANQQINENISYNTITSEALASAVSHGGILKIYLVASPTTGTITSNINNNTITITNAPTATTTGGIIGINNQGLTPQLAGATFNMNNNTIQNCVLSGSTSTTNGITGITNLSAAGAVNINNNRMLNNSITATTATTATFVGVANSGTAATLNINANTIRGFSNTSPALTTGGFIAASNSGAVTTSINIDNNIIGDATADASTSTKTGATTITNVFQNSAGAAGSTLSISGNSVKGLSFGSITSAGQVSGIFNTTGFVGGAITMNNNKFGTTDGGFMSFSAAAATPIYGILNQGGSATSVLTMTGNDIRGIVHTTAATAGAHSYLFNSAATLSQNISNNTFTNLNVNTAASITFISNSVSAPTGGSKTINGNSIVTGFSKPTAGGTVALYTDGGSSTATAGIQNNNNNFSNITLTGATIITGWFNNDGTGATPVKSITGNTFSNWTGGTSAVTVLQSNFGGSANISGNTITNITGQAAVTAISQSTSGTQANFALNNNTVTGITSTGTGGSVIGITTGVAATVATISGNTISGLSTTGTTSSVNGLVSSAGVTANLYQNKIYDLAATGAITTGSASVNGLVISGGTNVTAYNNLIGDLRAPAAAIADAIRGINVTSSTAASNINLYYNTIYLNASSTGATFGNTGIYHTYSTTATTASLTMKNNIIVNKSTPAGATGFAVAFRRSAATNLNNYNAASNNNLFYAGTPGTANLIFYDGTNSDQTIAAFKTRMATRDQLSVTEDAPFLSTTGSNATFLHINPAVPTQIESGGAAIAGITTDYDGDARNASTPDIGADEFAGIPIDLVPPVITYTALANTCSPGTNQILTATITDASGVPTTGVGLPVLYYKVNAGAYTAVQGVSIGSNQYTFTFGNTTTAAADVVSYYIVAQDNVSPTPNVGSFPAGGSGFTFNPPAASTPPTTPSTYTVTGSLNGTYTVGATGNYLTLTAAVADYNAKCLSGPVVFSLIDPSYSTAETFPITINNNLYANSTNTLTIRPAAGNTATITSASATAVIKINAANFITIDGSNTGGTDRNLNIVITSTNASTTAGVWVASTATKGTNTATVKNVNFTGNAGTTTIAAVVISASAFGSAAEVSNNNITITNNTISKFQNVIYGNGNATTGDQNWIFSNNVRVATLAADKGFRGINAINAVNFTISGNQIIGVASTSTSLASALLITGISSNGNVFNNTIKDVKNTYTGLYGSNGMYLASTSTTANIQVYNNMIMDVASVGYSSGTTVDDNGYGIFIGAGAGYKLYYNTVDLTTAQSGGAGISAAINIGSGVTVAGAIDLRNNIFANMQATGTRYTIYSAAPNTVFSNINYNDYYTLGTALGFIGSVRTTLTDIQTGFGGNANSVSVDPSFLSVTDAHVSNSSPVNGLATPIAGITTDIDGDVRNPTTPDIGCDEVTPTNNDAGATAFPGVYCPGSPANVTVTIKNFGLVPLTSATINWSVNGTPQTPFAWTGTLAPNATANVVVGTYTFAAAGTYTLSATTSLPNGVTDEAPGNDTYTITGVKTSLSGTYTVGAAGDFTSITAAVAAANTYGLCGPTVLSLTNAAYNTGETFPITINTLVGSSATNTLTIKPATGVSPVITGSNAVTLLKINGADYITVDGSNTTNGTTRNLTIQNNSTNTSSTVIWIASVDATNGAVNNTIKNSIVRGSGGQNTGTAIITSGSSVGAAAESGNNNTSIVNNLVQAASSGISVIGMLTTFDQNVLIKDNNLGSTVAADKIGFIGMQVVYQGNGLVTGNSIIGLSTTVSTYAGAGIDLFGGHTNMTVEKNILGDLKNTNSTGYGVVGILLESDNTAANITVKNNFVYDVAAYGYTGRTETDNGYGIGIALGGGYKIYNNTVAINTNQTASGYPAAFLVTSDVTTAGSIDLRNNIFANTATNAGQHYAIQSSAANTVFSNINYNDYYSTAANLGYIGSNRAALTDIVTGFGGNANSVSIAPVFVSPTNLHIDPAAPGNAVLDNLATLLAGVTTDIDGDVRNILTPDMGADEFSLCSATLYTWIGKTSTDWNTASNWCANAVPTLLTDVIIPPGTPFDPVINAGITGSAKSITIKTGIPTLTVAATGTLQVAGNFLNNATLTNNGLVKLVGGAAQSFPGAGTVAAMTNLEVANTSGGVTLNKSISVTNEFKSTSGNFDLSKFDVTLVSSAAATASVAPVFGTFSYSDTGKFIIERYLPAIKAWRFLAAPVKAATSPTITNSWRERGGNISTGYGTQITGPATYIGMDATTGTGSMKWYDTTTNAFKYVTNTGDPIANEMGYMVYVRGDRAVGLTGITGVTNLRIKGEVRTGDQPFTITKSKFLALGNPYPSALSIASLVSGTPGLAGQYIAWDPSLNGSYGSGGYQTFSNVDGYKANAAGLNGTSSIYIIDNLYPNVQSGQAFYIYNPSTTGSITGSIKENMKVTGSSLVSRENTPADREFIRTKLMINGAIADGNMVAYDDEFTNDFDGDDAIKFGNTGENFAMSRFGKKLVVEARSRIVDTDTIQFNMFNMRQQAYTVVVIPEHVRQNGMTAFFVDKYLGTRTPVSLTDSTFLPITITADAASNAAERFMIVFKETVVLPVNFISVAANRNPDRSIAVNWKVGNETNVTKYVVERSSDGRTFAGIITTDANRTLNYVSNDLSPLSEDNYYRIKAVNANGTFEYSAVVKVAPIKDPGFITINPNPAINKTVNVQFANEPKGTYTLELTNKLGQVVYNGKTDVQGATFVKTISLNPTTTAGSYQLKVTDAKGAVKTIQVVIE